MLTKFSKVYGLVHVFFILIHRAQAVSLAQSVFLPNDPKINPFSDDFIHHFVTSDSFTIGSFGQLTDSEMIFDLNRGNNSLFVPMSRNSFVDNIYESILEEKIDDQLEAQTDIDAEWISLMSAGPMVVNYVGNLLVLASKRDFPLNQRNNFTFRHIKTPSSFRSTMAQVSREIYLALLNAHTTMDKIQLRVEQVPENLKAALKLVVSGSPFLIQLTLPKTLDKISRIGNESAQLAAATFDKFSSVQELISEVILANVNTHSSQSNVVKQIEEEIEEHKRDRAKIEKEIHSVQSNYENSRKALEDARRDYQNALNAIPTRRFLRRLFRAIVKVVQVVIIKPIQAIGCIFRPCNSNAAAQAAATARENAIRRANELKLVLEQAERRHEQLTLQQSTSQQKLNQLINKLANLDLNRLSEQEIVDILVDVIKQMSEIKESWARLVRFFSRISVEADSMHKIIADEFINAIKDAQASNILMDPWDREIFAEMIGFSCQEIERSAHLLYIMSKTYYDVSTEYMIDQVAGMNMLLLFNTDAERSAHFNIMANTSKNVTDKITKLGQQRQNEYRAKNLARQLEYERFLQSIPEDELQAILNDSLIDE